MADSLALSSGLSLKRACNPDEIDMDDDTRPPSKRHNDGCGGIDGTLESKTPVRAFTASGLIQLGAGSQDESLISETVGIDLIKLRSRDLDATVSQGESGPYVNSTSTAAATPSKNNMHENPFCFGMIPNLQVRLSKDFHHAFSHSGENESFVLTVNLRFQDDYCSLEVWSGELVAIMNTKSSKMLLDSSQGLKVWFKTMITQSQCPSKEPKPDAAIETRVRSVDILVFGYLVDADVVAKRFATNGFYLQDPDRLPQGFTYKNPQCLELPERLSTEQDISDRPSRCETENMTMTVDAEIEEMDFDRILDAFSCRSGLSKVSAALEITTKLLDHQREGLDFISRQESRTSALSQLLWEQQEDIGGSLSFQHVITGARSSSRKPCPGGMIADEMGLGKSLTMLAAIAGSLHLGLAYAQSVTNLDNLGQGIIAAKSTLILVPSALLIDNWIDQIMIHVQSGAMSFYKYHGNGCNISYPSLLEHDVVFTTYGTIATHHRRKRSMLHQIKWYRVVLDEAHVIRNATTKQFRAVTTLPSLLRWALTGTPIQNSLGDLGSLVRFLKVPILDDAIQFRRHIIDPIERNAQKSLKDYMNVGMLLKAVCLRRTKSVVPVGQVHEYTHYVDFSPRERAEYARIEQVCKEALNIAVSGHKVKEAHQNVLEILLRLRLFCNHGRMHDSSLDKDGSEHLSLLLQEGEALCRYCSCDIGDLLCTDTIKLTACNKVICDDCFPRWTEDIAEKSECPLCHAAHDARQINHDSTINTEKPVHYPSKICALGDDIAEHRKEGKSVVFSFWKRSLDMAGMLLDAKGIQYLRIDGSLTFRRRKRILDSFQARKDIPVLLMTLGTGAVGLNSLSVANRIHLLEPQWNPSVEAQAIGRVVRLGQERAVTVVRYIVNRTVEKNIQSKQFRKLTLAQGGFAHGTGRDVMAKMQHLKTLIFQH